MNRVGKALGYVCNSLLLRFLLAGVLNTAAGAGLMFLLYNVFGASYWTSSACNYIFGGALSFFLNKFFTFKNRQKGAAQALFFALNLAACYFAAYAAARKIASSLPASLSEQERGNASLFFGMFLYTALNYLGQRFFVFREKSKKKEETL